MIERVEGVLVWKRETKRAGEDGTTVVLRPRGWDLFQGQYRNIWGRMIVLASDQRSAA